MTLHGWLSDTFKSLWLDMALEKMKLDPLPPTLKDEESNKSKSGTVIRTAIKAYDKESSVPSHTAYTTRKESRGVIVLRPEGVNGDHNHYRTVALGSTPDRAVSILTSDIIQMLKNAGWNDVWEGDLGENIYVDAIDYTFLEVGKRYKFQTKGSSDEDEGVIVEITERIEPCGSLCKLLYLDEKEGLRGWYGKVIGGWKVAVRDQVSALEITAA